MKANDLLRFAATLEGETLVTRARRAEFTIRVLPDGIEITPRSSGVPRVVSRDIVQRVCDEYERSQSLRTSDYQKLSFDASYLLALIDRYSRDART